MDAEKFMADLTVFNVITLLVSVVSLFVAYWSLRASRKSELFSLRSSVLGKAEKARSMCHMLLRENEGIIHSTEMNDLIYPPQKLVLVEGLKSHQEFIRNCLSDTSALADDVAKSIDNLSEKKCRKYLMRIERSVETLSRNIGVADVRYKRLIERITTSKENPPSS